MLKFLQQSLLIFFIIVLLVVDAQAGLHFTNREAAFVLQQDSIFKITSTDVPVGFGRSSIIKQRAGEGDYNIALYANGDQIITQQEAPSDLVYDNSNAINQLDIDVQSNSNTLLYLDRIDSNAKLFLTKNNSNTLLYLDRTDSNAKLFLTKNNSNAIIAMNADLSKQIRYNSNALLFGDRINSNAWLAWTENNSNALLELVKQNSNTLVALNRATSASTIFITKNNSNALIFGDRVNSNTLAYVTRTNSNALLFSDRVNSNTLVYNLRTYSNAFFYLQRTFSNAIAEHEIEITNNSNAINVLDTKVRTNSNTFLFLDRTDSNAKLFLTRNNSNAIISGNVGTLQEQIRHNSNTLLFLNRNNSNAIIAGSIGELEEKIRYNSNAVIVLDAQLQTIDHGPNNIIINSPTYIMTFDVYLSPDHIMSLQTDTVIDGNGHAIYFANNAPNILQVADGITVTFKNVTFRNYIDNAIQIGTGSTVLFDNQTVLVLNQAQQMLYTWNFTGNCFIHGHGNLLTIYPSNSIVVAPHSRLDIHDTSLDGLMFNNIRCSGPTATVAFQDCGLLLDNGVSFTTGAMEFGSDVYIRGTNRFSYESESALTVTSNSRLVMDGITFRYAPSVANRDLFTLLDRSAQLAIDGVTLASTTTGMRLSRGTLIVDHINNLVNESAISLSQGFALGNGNSDDDLDIQVKPGASLTLISGILDYQNVGN